MHFLRDLLVVLLHFLLTIHFHNFLIFPLFVFTILHFPPLPTQHFPALPNLQLPIMLDLVQFLLIILLRFLFTTLCALRPQRYYQSPFSTLPPLSILLLKKATVLVQKLLLHFLTIKFLFYSIAEEGHSAGPKASPPFPNFQFSFLFYC